MNPFAAKSILAASLLGIAGFGHANTTVDFAPLTSYYDGTAGDGATYLEGGLTFTSPTGGLKNWGTWRDWNADPLGAVLYDNYASAVTIAKTAGGSFSLVSFDLADLFNDGSGGPMPFSYTDGAGLHITTLLLDNQFGLQTFFFNFNGLTSFSVGGSGTYFQLDNVVVDGVTAVPEPATCALLIAGLGAVGVMTRRRKP